MCADEWRQSTFCLALVWWLSLLLTMPVLVQAERLPIKVYTTADGLAQNAVNRIGRDSRGFLWFCTEGGLSRYDGYSFTNYGVEQGLPDGRIRDFLETRDGEYWIATGGGLCRFNPRGLPLPTGSTHNPQSAIRNPQLEASLFEVFYPHQDERARFVTALLQDQSGALWVGTHGGLFRLERSGRRVSLQPVEVGMPVELREGRQVYALCTDRHGTLWIAAYSGLYCRWPDGHAARYTQRDGLPDNVIQALCEDRQGNLWVGTRQGGFFRLATDASRNPPVVARAYTGLVSNWVNALLVSSDQRLWIATNNELGELLLSGHEGEQPFRFYTRKDGLSYYHLTSLLEDHDGNLWIGTTRMGAMKLTRRGFHTFGVPDGIVSVRSVSENRSGELHFVGYVPRPESEKKVNRAEAADARPYDWRLGRFDGQQFTWLRPKLPTWVDYYGWGWNQISFQDHTGEWWIATGRGLFRFPKVKRFEELQSVRPKAVYTAKEGLASEDIFRLFEDSRGDIWISTFSIQRGFAKWERATETLRDMSQAEGLLPLKERVPSAFCEDAAGHLWLGFYDGGLARYAAGRFTLFSAGEGVPAGRINDLHLDHRGRLWIASALGGLARLEDPSTERPTFITYTTADGLSSNKATCVTEDRFGRIYVGTGRGLDRLNPATGQIKHFTAADGLMPGDFEVIYCDRQGAIWIGSWLGLSRFVPQPDPPQSPPPILISTVRIAGIPQPISALGETTVGLPDLAAEKNDLQLDFVGLSFAPGEVLRYQYKLEGADQTWSAPTDQRTVNYANLASGQYRFLVRAINSDGVVSPTPATITFTILRPVWQRWWFLTLAMMLLAGVVWLAYRYRVARLLEMERVRTRIAADLHDDIGSNLSRIALLSEVVRQQVRHEDQNIMERLSLISSVSRESVDAMSDIVWAINPKRDRLRDLTQRMRRFAEDAFQARNIEFRFRAPSVEQDIKLGADMRREIFLIFKESVNNMIRHSGCTEADIDFQIEGGWLVLKLSDNGKGLDLTHAGEGHGLVSMRQRAKKLGGELEIRSPNGQGTTVTLRAPLR